MKKFILAAMMAALIIPAAASANEGNPQNCEANPQQPFCGDTISVEPASAEECPAGGLAIIVGNVRYPVCNGAVGQSGPQGNPGVDGSNGANGSNGATGESGSNGSSGTDGINGTNGVDGAMGSPGGQSVIANAPVVTTIYAYVTSPHRPQRCERRFNKHGKLVVVCHRTTCPRRQGGKKNRRVVVVCRKEKHEQR